MGKPIIFVEYSKDISRAHAKRPHHTSKRRFRMQFKQLELAKVCKN